MPSNSAYPLSAIRALALHVQRLDRPPGAGGKPIRDDVYAAIERIGGVQIDTPQGATGGELSAERTTFLSPFDNLFWAKDRDMDFWGFRQVLETYKPEPQRVWGYFCLPILRNDALIGLSPASPKSFLESES